MSKMWLLFFGTLCFTVPVKAQQGVAMRPFDYGSQLISNRHFSLSKENKQIVVCGMSGLLQGGWALWDLTTGRRCSMGELKVGSTHTVALSPDRRWIAAGGDGAELKLFDAISGKIVHNLEGHRACFGHVEFTPDGNYLISLADDNIIRLWSMADKKPFAKYCFTAEKKDDNLWALHPDEPHEKAKITVIHEQVIQKTYSFVISPSGKLLAVATGTKDVFLIETLTGKLVKRIRCQKIGTSLSVNFSLDGTLLAVGGASTAGVIEIWKMDHSRDIPLAVLDKHDDSVLDLAISADNKTVVSGGLADGVRVWDLRTGKLKYRLHQPKDDEYAVRTVAFMADGKTILTLPHDQPVRFWNAATGESVDPIRKKQEKP